MVLTEGSTITLPKFLDKIGLKGRTFLTDDWDGFHRLIPEAKLFTGKDLTFPIEQDNSDIRSYLLRFRRRTKVVSKSLKMVDLTLRLHHHLDIPENHTNRAKAFRWIFA